jgi:hypothetical protein
MVAAVSRHAGDWQGRRFVEFVDHPVEFVLHCGCTRVVVGRAPYFIGLLGRDARPLDAERRMRCRTCLKRPTLKLARIWTVSTQPGLPDWMAL